MTNSKRLELARWLDYKMRAGDEESVRKIVLLLTLVFEVVSPELLRKLHVQNVARAKHGRHSEQAETAAVCLKTALKRRVLESAESQHPAEAYKKEFVECNPANNWSQVHPAVKAAEELRELAVALDGEQYSERVLDALLDVVYAGTEVAGVHY